ncbi:MAG: NYN domain-containing protein [Lachnospiraceae bacterium]|nr:NYN domain-containing protein [Lachnospiraceae bacterium]
MEKKYALLIDAENADIKYLTDILNELKTYGNVTYKRMYGDFTSSTMKEWNRRALEYAIVPIQQPHYSKYKNAADIMLVIDAMDILYNKSVDGFCIVSNDSDYTRLVNRLCEAGYEVIGMGSSNASKTLKAACTEFKNLEKIFSDDLDTVDTRPANQKKGRKSGNVYEEDEDKGNITPIEEIRNSVMNLVQKDEKAGLGGIKSTLQRQFSDFDERNYGFTTIRKFIESMKDFQVVQEDSTVYVTMKQPDIEELEINQFIRSLLFQKPYEMGELSNKVHEKFDGFDPKHYGYNQFGKFVSNIDGVVVVRDANNNAIAQLEE